MRLDREADPLPRLFVLAVATLVILAGTLRVVQPAALAVLVPGSGRCPLRALAGVPCPTCGATRAAAALARGEIGQALALNPLVTLGLSVLLVGAAVALVMTLVPAWRRQISLTGGEKRVLVASVMLAVAVGWTFEILRLG